MRHQDKKELTLEELDALLATLGKDSFEPVEESADDLARVRMNSDYTIAGIELLEPSLDPEIKRRLEGAVETAVNAAFRKVGELQGERLAAWSQKQP